MDVQRAIKELNTYEHGTSMNMGLPTRIMITRVLREQQQEIERLTNLLNNTPPSDRNK